MGDTDRHFMKLALQEARKGLGRTSPNPSVGAVVVRNGTIVGKGYHKKAGLPHAEPNALQDAGNKAEGSTIYVTLEPCNHAGRTPPCTRAILEAGIQRVVIGMADPNPKVTGSGADFLAAQGVAVTSGVLEYECCELNRPFIKHATTGLPWVIMKAGTSMDGRIAAGIGRQTAITGTESLHQVHLLRDRVDAILIGVETAITDDPSLTTRLGGRRPGRDPERIILDTNLRLLPAAKMLSTAPSAIPSFAAKIPTRSGFRVRMSLRILSRAARNLWTSCVIRESRGGYAHDDGVIFTLHDEFSSDEVKKAHEKLFSNKKFNNIKYWIVDRRKSGCLF